MKRLNKKGVSLSELLAVVVIMGIIAAIAIPLVGNVIDTARKKAFLGDLITLTEATRSYCSTQTGGGKNNVCLAIVYGNRQNPGDALKDNHDGTVTMDCNDRNGITGDPWNKVDNDSPVQKYISKPISEIGSDIHVVTDGKKYFVSVMAGSRYTTKQETANGPLELFINPTAPNALDFIIE